jgi:hypothetical protein
MAGWKVVQRVDLMADSLVGMKAASKVYSKAD